MSAVITATGLSKRYKNSVALDNVSFQIPAGRIVGLIGPNGAGKTTALKAILGLTDFSGQLNVLEDDRVFQRDVHVAELIEGLLRLLRAEGVGLGRGSVVLRVDAWPAQEPVHAGADAEVVGGEVGVGLRAVRG